MSGVCDGQPIKPDVRDAKGGVFPYLTRPISAALSRRLRLPPPPFPSWLLPLSLLRGVSLVCSSCHRSACSFSSLTLVLSLCHFSVLYPACALCACGCVKRQSDWGRPQMPVLDLEHWYQEVMAAGDVNQLCPPPLPAKAFSSSSSSPRRPVQVTVSSSAVFHTLLPLHVFIFHLHGPFLSWFIWGRVFLCMRSGLSCLFILVCCGCSLIFFCSSTSVLCGEL